MSRHTLTDNGFWILLWASFLVTSLYSRPPVPVDETRYLSVAWEMWHNNQFLIPHINGQFYSHKPPLLFWLIQFGWWIFGVNEWSARLTSPLFCFGSILLTLRLGRMLWPQKEEITATVPYFLLGMCVWSFYGTLTMFDMLIAFLALLAYSGIIYAAHGKRLLGWLIFSLSTGLGILAKGPVILLFTVPPVVFAPWWEKDIHVSWKRWYGSFILALAGSFALALVWAIPASLTGGTEYAYAIFFRQTAGRVINSFAHKRPFYWYGMLLPLILFPWSFWPPAWRAFGRINIDPGSRFCLSIIIPPVILLSLISGKQIHYILPILPMLSLLFAKAMADNRNCSRSPKWTVPIILFLFGVVLLAMPHIPFHGGDSEMLSAIPLWLGLIPISIGIFIFFTLPSNPLKQIKTISAATVLLMIFLQLALRPSLLSLYDLSPVANTVRDKQDQGYSVAIMPPRLKDQFQFAGHLTKPLITLNNVQEMASWTRQNPQQYYLIFVRNEKPSLLLGDGIIDRFNNGYLVLRSARNFEKT